MGPKTRLSSYCSNRGDDTVNLETSHKTNARLVPPIPMKWTSMDINSVHCIHTRLYKIYSFYGICGDVYDRLDYETHTTDKTVRYL